MKALQMSDSSDVPAERQHVSQKNCGMEQKGLENVSEERDTINKVTLLVTKV